MDEFGQLRTGRTLRQVRRACRAAATVVTLSALAAPVFAQYGETAKVARPIPATNSLDATAAGSEVVVRDRTAAQTTDQLLQESAGTRVVAAGAPGSPFCVRLRGVACDQVTVMLGDVPISSPDTGAFDLSMVPLEAVDGFEVFRGGTPAWLNDGAVGGVLRFQPRTYKETEVGVRATGGSFGSWRANLFGAASGEKVQFFGTAGGAGAQNDYPYLVDNGTLSRPQRRRRASSARTQTSSRVSAIRNHASSRPATRAISTWFSWVWGGTAVSRVQASSPALQARTKTSRLIGSASWLQEKDGAHPYRLQVAANYDYGRNRLTDALAELGNGGPRRTDDQTHAIFGRVAGTGAVHALARGHGDRLRPLSGVRPTRTSFLVEPRPRVRPVVRGGHAGDPFFRGARQGRTRAASERSLGLDPCCDSERSARWPNRRASRPTFLPTYRVGGAISPLEWLAFRGSVSSGYKLPSLLQLFGNRTNVEGNPELVPGAFGRLRRCRDRSRSLAGAQWVRVGRRVSDPPRRRDSVSQDLTFTFKAENIGGARSRGVEVEFRGASPSTSFSRAR